MRVEGLELVKPEIAKRIEELYGPLSIGPDGQILDTWIHRNIRKVRLGVSFRHSAFLHCHLRFVPVNRRMVRAITSVYQEVAIRWTLEAQEKSGITIFQKCFCFGDGDAPNLFWYAAAWQLPMVLKGEILREMVKIFVRHGFTPRDDNERVLEYW
jgi:hypothetical protein